MCWFLLVSSVPFGVGAVVSLSSLLCWCLLRHFCWLSLPGCHLFGWIRVVVARSLPFSVGFALSLVAPWSCWTLIQCAVAGRSHGLGCTAASISGVPGLLSVGQSGAPPCSKGCSHGTCSAVAIGMNAVSTQGVSDDARTGDGMNPYSPSLTQCTAGLTETMTLRIA